MADIDFDSDDGFDLRSGKCSACATKLIFDQLDCVADTGGAVSSQSTVSSVRTVNQDYASCVAELLQQASAARQLQVVLRAKRCANC
jgi:hypothetical protein